MKSNKFSLGFSLIEAMITIAMASVVLAGAYYFFLIEHSSYKGQSDRLAIEDSLRGSMDFVVRSVKQAVVFPVPVASAGSLAFSYSETFGRGDAVNTTTTLNDSRQTWTSNQWRNFKVVITSGTGRNQVCTIASNSSTCLTVSTCTTGTGWAIIPDDSSEYKIISTRQFTLVDNTLQYQNSMTGESGVVADNVSAFTAQWASTTPSQVTISMTSQTQRVAADYKVKGSSTLQSSVNIRN